jgi:iron complex outermembrane receptor protein
VARQKRVESTDSPTPGHTLLDLWAAWRLPLVPAGQELQLFARLANATDRLAKNATTIATLRDLAPLPGRSFAAGMRWRF